MLCVVRSGMKIIAAASIGIAALVVSFSAQAGTGAYMQTGKLTSQPIGHYEFCKREAAECNIVSRDTRALSLNNNNWQLIQTVNLSANERIKPMTDMEIYGVEEYWAYPTTVGDCEDYVLLKQRELAKAGIPMTDLLITVVRKPDGEGHAVLTVRTDRGDFVLDNLTDEVLRWDETEYTYLKRQAANNTGRWVTIESPDNLLVGAVK
ncbi:MULTISPECIES: transglutaminase-like cysteine peptidase [Brucella/Ochrobactrum group]|uniref:Transglutaminase-like cysteine proteinase n=1 Tax=Brucella pseudogrignonensis TaxID=419475 RepID=A0ABU1M9P2_9HYPH|nr:transglutaminase-like cysteine peptidase [Brucella pseudogrignonensis]MCL7997335.1 transglutaminase-like cysteine peptidase [Brucella sp. 21LCYQ03]MDR6432739.1 putative transglutaminase-like cysteine proteinase [Brucella pseudogrignonensis]